MDISEKADADGGRLNNGKRTDARFDLPRREVGDRDEKRFTCRVGPARHIDGAQGNLCRHGGEYDWRA